MSLTFHVFSFIHITLGISKLANTFSLIQVPLAFINASIFIFHCAVSFSFVIEESAFVYISIGEFQNSVSRIHSIDPVSRVGGPVCQCHGACPVEFIILENALILHRLALEHSVSVPFVILILSLVHSVVLF